jgi:hypothetical protein
MFRLVCDIGTEVASNNAMPCGVILFVKFFLDISCNVLITKKKGVKCQIRRFQERKCELMQTFSILYFSNACDAQSTASCCISSDISALLITALRSAILLFVVFLFFSFASLVTCCFDVSCVTVSGVYLEETRREKQNCCEGAAGFRSLCLEELTTEQGHK